MYISRRILLCILRDLAGGGLLVVAVGVSDMRQVNGSMWHRTHDTWNLTHNMWCLILKKCILSVLLFAHVGRFSVSCMLDFKINFKIIKLNISCFSSFLPNYKELNYSFFSSLFLFNILFYFSLLYSWPGYLIIVYIAKIHLPPALINLHYPTILFSFMLFLLASTRLFIKNVLLFVGVCTTDLTHCHCYKLIWKVFPTLRLSSL